MNEIPPLVTAYGYRHSLTSLMPDGPDFVRHCPTPSLDLKKSYRPHPALAEPIVQGDNLSETKIIDLVIDLLLQQKVAYGDLRLGRELTRSLYIQDTNLQSHERCESEGIGIRVWHEGAWGFCGTADLSENSLRRTTLLAVGKARAAAQMRRHVLGGSPFAEMLWPRPSGDTWKEFHTPVLECPFSSETARMAGLMSEGAAVGLNMTSIRRVESSVEAYGRRRLFANTLGARVLTTHCVVDSSQKFIAVDKGRSAYRTVEASALAGGIEHLESARFAQQAQRAAFEARLKCLASTPPAGAYDLILDPHNLALTMHESVGHPTELDRVMGYELGFAGGSFAQISDLKRLTYGSSLVNFSAHNHLLFGPSSTGIDDEGTVCQMTPIIREGYLVGFGNNLETACLTGTQPNGNCRSTSWTDTPIVRIPNLYLEPGTQKLSLDELISNTDRGIVLLGRDSFSIDQMRSQFQFGSDMAYLVEKGRIVAPLRDVIYQSLTTDFWQRCDAICDQSEWQMHGVFNCGKGQPMQLGKMLHGGAPARFRGISVGY